MYGYELPHSFLEMDILVKLPKLKRRHFML